MNDPRRLFDDSIGFELDLLRAGRGDEPPAGAEKRAAIALGLATGAVVTTTATATSAMTAAATAKNVTAVAAATKATWFGGTAMVVKAIGIGVATTVVTAAVIHTATKSAPPPAPTHIETPASGAAHPTARAPAVNPRPEAKVEESPVQVAAVAAEAAPQPVPVPMGAAPAKHAVPAELGTRLPAATPEAKRDVTPVASLSDEMALLDRARAALGSGNATATLKLVDEHDATFNQPAFKLESNVLRIDALDVLGLRSDALEAADRFLVLHPNEPMSKHVRTVAERLRAINTNP